MIGKSFFTCRVSVKWLLTLKRLRWAGNSGLSAWYKCLIEKTKVEIIKHKLNSKSQAGTTADKCKNC
jgi:hypothetical protein